MADPTPTTVAEGRTPPRGRMRTAQREFTRSRLIEAAVAVFAERGYAKATVDEIAERAGTTRATFYLHFKAKGDLVIDFMERGGDHFHRIYQDLSPIAHDPTIPSVRGWLATAMHEWRAVADFARPVGEAAMIEPEVHALMVQRESARVAELADALRVGEPTVAPRDAEVYASVLLAPLSYYFHLFLRGQRFDERRVLDVMAASWMAVISQLTVSPKRRQRT